MISFSRHSGIYTLEAKQFLPVTIEEAWDFFSSPVNLRDITPAHMNFEITSKCHGKAYTGQIITYRVSPIPGFRTSWVTEITHVEEGKYFVDEQRFGPYSMWHHEHIFEVVEGGVMMTDRVSYKIPLGILGHMAHVFFIKKQLTDIFSYRNQVLSERFPVKAEVVPA
jgi:ligand-binding SRPBCC domain-containing protein